MTDEELRQETIRLEKQDKRDNIWMFFAYASYLIAFMMVISVPIDFLLANLYYTGRPEFYWLGFIAIPFYIAGKLCFKVLYKHADARKVNQEEIRRRSKQPKFTDTIICHPSDYMEDAYLIIKTVYKSDVVRKQQEREKKALAKAEKAKLKDH